MLEIVKDLLGLLLLLQLLYCQLAELRIYEFYLFVELILELRD